MWVQVRYGLLTLNICAWPIFIRCRLRPILVSVALTVTFVGPGVSFQKAWRITCSRDAAEATSELSHAHDAQSTPMQQESLSARGVVAAKFGLTTVLIIDAVGFSRNAQTTIELRGATKVQ